MQPTAEKHALTAIELAKLAALLAPQACLSEDPEEHLRKTYAFYFTACEFHRKLEDIFENNDISAHLRLLNANTLEKLITRSKKSYELYPDDSPHATDTAKAYLTAHAGEFNYKTTRSVLEMIRKYFIDKANNHNREHAKNIAALEQAHERMAHEQNKSVAALRNGMFIPDDCQWWDGEQNCKEFLAQQARSGFSGLKSLKKDEIQKTPKVKYWALDEEFLDNAISWRREFKKNKANWKALRMQPRTAILEPYLRKPALSKK